MKNNENINSLAASLGFTNSNLYGILAENVSKRFEITYGTDLLKFLFYLTPAGRIEARRERKELQLLDEDDSLDKLWCDPNYNFHKPPELKIDVDALKDYLLNKHETIVAKRDQLKRTYQSLLSSITASYFNDYEEEANEEYIGDEDNESRTFDDTMPFVLSCSLNDVETVVLQRAKAIKKSLNANDYEVDIYSSSMLRMFNYWIMHPINEANIINLCEFNAWRFWKEFSARQPAVKGFADFVMRHLSIVANSASCERAFWYEARHMPPERFRTSEPVLLARLLLSND